MTAHRGQTWVAKVFPTPSAYKRAKKGTLFVLLLLWNPGLKGVRFCGGQTERALRAVVLPRLGEDPHPLTAGSGRKHTR